MKGTLPTLLLGILFMTTLNAKFPEKFLNIGHRGACGYEPENTLRSFKKALELGVDAIELDVYCCKSGELVVIHDDTLDRTTNGHGYVQEKTLSELKTLDAGKGEQIPTLQEVFELVNRKVIINIELKGPGTAQAVADLLTHYMAEHGWEWDDFFVSSFDHYELQTFTAKCPNVKIGAIITGIPLGYAEFGTKLNAHAVVICSEFINQAYVDDAHKRGMKVYVYTVNEPDEIMRIKAFGVDGIFSNYPEKLSHG